MNRYIILISLVFLASCKSAKPLANAGNVQVDNKITAEKVIAGNAANKIAFSTIYIKANAHYEDAKQSQNVTAEIRIKKDEMILVSIRFLGITMAKALITPTQVKYYEKIKGSYFEGDFAALSQWLGTDLDFQKVQHLLLGQVLDDLKTGNYKVSVENNFYKLESESGGNTTKKYFFEPQTFQLKKEEISQEAQNRMLEVLYPGFNQINGGVTLPTGLVIDANQKKGKTNISIEYNSATINEAMTFPYSVPDGYERILIN